MDTEPSSEFTVLLVDDDDIFRKQVAEYLGGDGFQIVEATRARRPVR